MRECQLKCYRDAAGRIMAIDLTQSNWYCENCGALLHKRNINKGICWKCCEEIEVVTEENLEQLEEEAEDYTEAHTDVGQEIYCWKCGEAIQVTAHDSLRTLEQESNDHEKVSVDTPLKG